MVLLIVIKECLMIFIYTANNEATQLSLLLNLLLNIIDKNFNKAIINARLLK